jgi:hypothetical protein
MPDLGQIRCYDIDEIVGLAWYEFLTTDAATARDRLERAAHGWLAEQSVGLAMLAAFALFRLRFGDCAGALLDRIEVPADWPFGDAVSALIRARRPADYVTAGDAFRAQGMRLFAAEAYHLAATRTRPHGPPQRTRALQAAAALAQQCRADTPLLGRLSPATALTRREEQIAALAAGGASNREVAQHLGLSERTVESVPVAQVQLADLIVVGVAHVRDIPAVAVDGTGGTGPPWPGTHVFRSRRRKGAHRGAHAAPAPGDLVWDRPGTAWWCLVQGTIRYR